ncbi:DUF5701 family protein [Nocardiopsis lucentensis]|uniref:DUF5701 family protein n=1 Tax=Nocardiopsis lucentensis TaxID=53441 RepID=UPI000344CA2A|nr:DUF5701 family protein [Nocardiopsis lucentensis]
MTEFDAGAEFDRQTATLVDLGYPARAGMAEDAFRALLAPLREAVLARAAAMAPPAEGRIPFLVVVTRELVPLEESVPLTTLAGRTRPGFIDHSYAPGELERFVSTDDLGLPEGRAYVVFDVDRGEEFCGAVPLDALTTIAGRDRTPLTIEEGVAIVTQYPEALAKNTCFSLGGTRMGDRRVPALWISKVAPKLGWCWERNPHTWLGMASAGCRVG